MAKCLICEKHSASDNGFCHNCGDKLKSQRVQKQAKQAYRFLTYRGDVVGLYQNGGGKFVAILLKRDPAGLPKGKTLDLNEYLPGFTREQVKKFKTTVLKLASVKLARIK